MGKPAGTSTAWQMALMALAYLWGRKLRTVLTTLSIVFGVALIFAMNLVLPNVMDAFTKMVTATSGGAELSIGSVTGESFPPDGPLQTVAGIPDVAAVSGVLRRQITLPSAPAKGGTIGALPQIELVGVDPVSIGKVRSILMSAGRFLQPGDRGRAVVPAALTDLVPQLDVGVALPLVTARGVKIYGIVGLLATQDASAQVIVPLPDAQAAFNQPGLVNALEVSVKGGADRDRVAAEIVRALGGGFEVNRTRSQADAVGTVRIGIAIFNLMGMIALFMGAFLIFNTFRTVVVERRHDFAMLRAVGARRRQIVESILIEAVIQGALGTGAGLLLGYGLADLLGRFLQGVYRQFMPSMTVAMHFELRALGIPVVLGLLATMLASFLPARDAGRMAPLEGLRPPGAPEVRQAAHWNLVFGALLIGLASVLLVASPRTTFAGTLLFLVGLVMVTPGLIEPMARGLRPLLMMCFAREGDVAQGNVARHPGRAAITASTLMIGLAVLIMIAAVSHGLEVLVTTLTTRSFRSDILVTPATVGIYGNVVGADDGLANRLRAVQNVQTVASLRWATGRVDEQSVQLFGIDPTDYPKVSSFQFSHGRPDESYAKLARGRALLVNSLAASSLGLDVGQSATVETVNGPETYEVVGVADELLGFKLRTLYTSQANLKTDFNKAEDVTLMIGLAPAADRVAALAAVEDALKDYPQFSAKATGEFRTQLIAMSTGAMRAVYGLAVLILIPAALGLLNTLTINVLERTREIGVLRAVGGSRGHVRRIVMAEALLLGAVGACIGVVGGAAMSYGFTRAFTMVGWTLPYEFPVAGVVAAVVAAFVLALAASILPARYAARLDIVRALQYE